MIVLFIIIVEIFVQIKWSYRSPSIMLIIEPKMVILSTQPNLF